MIFVPLPVKLKLLDDSSYDNDKFIFATNSFDYSTLTMEQKQYMATLSQEELAKLMQTYSENANALPLFVIKLVLRVLIW